jgi:hypothetical protein
MNHKKSTWKKSGKRHQKEHCDTGSSTNSPLCGRCHMVTETASHILCECVVSANSDFFKLGKQFMEPSDNDVILVCKILYFVRSTGLVAE